MKPDLDPYLRGTPYRKNPLQKLKTNTLLWIERQLDKPSKPPSLKRAATTTAKWVIGIAMTGAVIYECDQLQTSYIDTSRSDSRPTRTYPTPVSEKFRTINYELDPGMFLLDNGCIVTTNVNAFASHANGIVLEISRDALDELSSDPDIGFNIPEGFLGEFIIDSTAQAGDETRALQDLRDQDTGYRLPDAFFEQHKKRPDVIKKPYYISVADMIALILKQRPNAANVQIRELLEQDLNAFWGQAMYWWQTEKQGDFSTDVRQKIVDKRGIRVGSLSPKLIDAAKRIDLRRG